MTKAEMKMEESKEALAIQDDASAEEEIDYVAGFLKAAEMLKEETTKIEIRRKGQLLFSFKIHALSEQDILTARKMATSYMTNPRNKKLPKVAKEYNNALGNSCIIYLATTDEDKEKLWDNIQLKNALMTAGILPKNFVGTGYDIIDKVLSAGEKQLVIDEIDKLCGYSNDDDEDEDFSDIDIAKN